MRNRHGVEYDFALLSENTYTITGDLKYWRFGGKEGTSGVDMNDLGFVDPSGGPFISVGSMIKGKRVVHISATNEWESPFQKQPKIIFKVE